jgi:hypothetical protein
VASESGAADLFRLRTIPSAVLPYTRREKVLRFFSRPFFIYVALMALLMVVQFFVPAPRFGVETVWDADLRTVIGLFAIAPSIIIGTVRTRQQLKGLIGPSLFAKEIALSAVFGALLAGIVAWSLGAPLTPVFSGVAFILTLLWISVTGIVSVFFSEIATLTVIRDRLKRAKALGISVAENDQMQSS